MNINIQEIINAKIEEMAANKVIENKIQNCIEKTILGAIEEELGCWTFKDIIKTKLKKEVSSVVSEIGFTAYNSFIAEKIAQITEGAIRQDVAKQIQESFNNILVLKRDSIKLSEICDAYRDYICGVVEEPEKYSLERFYVEIKENEQYKWLDITLAKEKFKGYASTFKECVRFTVHRNKDGKTGWVSNIYLNDRDITKTVNFGNLSTMEALLVNVCYNKTPIEIDVESEDDIDNSFDIDN